VDEDRIHLVDRQRIEDVPLFPPAIVRDEYGTVVPAPSAVRLVGALPRRSTSTADLESVEAERRKAWSYAGQAFVKRERPQPLDLHSRARPELPSNLIAARAAANEMPS
jgi:hypothetical protein